jgi:nucleoside-diphosphate-sugar epimerase
MSMRVLVTGAGGNLGRATLPALAEAGHTVRALDFRPLDIPHELVVADVRDARAVAEAAAGCDAVVHAAALHGIPPAHLDGPGLLDDQRPRHLQRPRGGP